MKKHTALAALTAIAVGIAAIVPVIAHYLFAALGWIFTTIGTGFTLLAMWFATTIDEPHEKAIWGAITIFLTFAMLYYFGLPLLQYWWLIVIAAIIFGIAVAYAYHKIIRNWGSIEFYKKELKREKRKKKRRRKRK